MFQAGLAGGVSTPAIGEPAPDGIVTISPDAFAEASLRFLGAPKTVAAPHLVQALSVAVLDMLPRRLVWHLVGSETTKLIHAKIEKEKKKT